MSSLRDLLDIATTDNIPVATYYGSNSHSILWRGDHCWEYSSNHSYAHQELVWCVPSCCVCKVEFEVWGGGGGGGGSCCCMSGVAGHSPGGDGVPAARGEGVRAGEEEGPAAARLAARRVRCQLRQILWKK